jgi:hypothetical protein
MIASIFFMPKSPSQFASRKAGRIVTIRLRRWLDSRSLAESVGRTPLLSRRSANHQRSIGGFDKTCRYCPDFGHFCVHLHKF